MSKELLEVIKAVAGEKGIDNDFVFTAMEAALELATKKCYGNDMAVRVAIDRKTGHFDTYQRWLVISDDEARLAEKLNVYIDDTEEEKEFPLIQVMSLSEAKLMDPLLTELEPGVERYVEKEIPSIDFGRIAVQSAKQVIVQKVREAERAKVVDAFERRLGELVIGTVKKVTREGVLVDLGDSVEALLPRHSLLPRDAYRPSDRVRAVIHEVKPDSRGPLVMLSRTSPAMLVELFRVEVPEIGEEIIEIKACARDPGSRAKVAVKTNDGRIDPTGACVGMRGARVQAVSGELAGERIDIIVWNDDPAQMVINAMAPAEVASIMMDEEAKSIDVAVRDDMLAQAIGKNGQNVRLASELCGWALNVMSVSEAEEKAKAETERYVMSFQDQLGIDEDSARALVQEGFTSLEDVAYAPQADLYQLLDAKEVVDAMVQRAKDRLLAKALAGDGGVASDDLKQLEGMTPALLQQLLHHGVCDRDALAELSVADLLEYATLSEEEAGKLIITARQHWFV